MHNYIPVKNVPFFSMLLLCSFFRLIKRIISSEKWFNYIVFFFFLENDKNLGRSDDVNGENKRGWPYSIPDSSMQQ